MRQPNAPWKMLSTSSTSSSATARLSSAKAFKVRNICGLLTRKSQGFYTKDAGVVYRKNMGILRQLICQESTTFKNVWTTHSTSPIAYQSGKIYFDNYRCCVSSVTPEPRIIYQMPVCPKSEKIEDALLLECPLGEVLPNPSDYKPSLAVLTAHNWLFRLSASTGEIVEKVYLASHCKFRYLSWDCPQETMVVKSAQCKVQETARQAGIQQSVLFFLAAFRVLPLSFIGMLEIDKKNCCSCTWMSVGKILQNVASTRGKGAMYSIPFLQVLSHALYGNSCQALMNETIRCGVAAFEIFGNSITDATVSHRMLIVMHSAGLVRLYSFQSISEKFMTQQVDLGRECNWNGKVGTVGKYPFGIPCNIKITETPDVLFEVSSLENTFQVGGYPWHYIITPNKKSQRGIFHVCSLKDHTLAKNGIQDMKCCSLEPDWISFHPDSSGRILHVGPNLIKILKLKETESITEQQEVKEDFIIEAHRENNATDSVTVTSSGRVVKKRINVLDDDPEQETFKIVDYEDELDLLSVVAVTQIGGDGAAHLDFHCNEFGTQLKRILFKEPWDVTYSHEVYFDRNVVLHMEQKPNRIFSCYVYQMVCSGSKEGEDARKDKRGRRLCKKMGRTFECF